MAPSVPKPAPAASAKPALPAKTADETAGALPYGLLYAGLRREFAAHYHGEALARQYTLEIPPLDMREPEDIAAFEALCNAWFTPFIPTPTPEA